ALHPHEDGVGEVLIPVRGAPDECQRHLHPVDVDGLDLHRRSSPFSTRRASSTLHRVEAGRAPESARRPPSGDVQLRHDLRPVDLDGATSPAHYRLDHNRAAWTRLASLEASMGKALGPSAIAQYERDGYYFPVPVLSADEARRYRERLERVEDELGGP